jgi:hypothetical protein
LENIDAGKDRRERRRVLVPERKGVKSRELEVF